MSTHYDLDRAVRESGLPPDVVETLRREVAEEFPDGGLMYELHLVRALEGELFSRLSPEEWRARQTAAVQHALDASGMELVTAPGESTPRLVRRGSQPSAG